MSIRSTLLLSACATLVLATSACSRSADNTTANPASNAAAQKDAQGLAGANSALGDLGAFRAIAVDVTAKVKAATCPRPRRASRIWRSPGMKPKPASNRARPATGIVSTRPSTARWTRCAPRLRSPPIARTPCTRCSIPSIACSTVRKMAAMNGWRLHIAAIHSCPPMSCSIQSALKPRLRLFARVNS